MLRLTVSGREMLHFLILNFLCRLEVDLRQSVLLSSVSTEGFFWSKRLSPGVFPCIGFGGEPWLERLQGNVILSFIPLQFTYVIYKSQLSVKTKRNELKEAKFRQNYITDFKDLISDLARKWLKYGFNLRITCPLILRSWLQLNNRFSLLNIPLIFKSPLSYLKLR